MPQSTSIGDAILFGYTVSKEEAENLSAKMQSTDPSIWVRARWLGYLTKHHLTEKICQEQALWFAETYPASKLVNSFTKLIAQTRERDILEAYEQNWNIRTSEYVTDRNQLECGAWALQDLYPEKSLAIMNRLIKKWPDQSHYLINASRLAWALANESTGLQKQNYLKQAFALIEHAANCLQGVHSSANNFLIAAEISYVAGQYTESEFHVAQAWACGPGNGANIQERDLKIETILGLIALKKNIPAKALDHFSRVTKLISDASGYFSEATPTVLAEGLVQYNSEIVISFIEACPEKYLAHSKEKTLSALQAGNPIQLWEGSYSANVLTQRADRMLLLGRKDEALKLVLRASMLNESSAVSLYGMGVMFDRLGEAEAAINNFKKAFEFEMPRSTAKKSNLLEKISPHVRSSVQQFL